MLGCPRSVGEKVVDATINGIRELTIKESITITNFGTFELKNQKEKIYRDIHSGELKKAPAKRKVIFTQSKNYFKEVPSEDSGRRNNKH